jgi:hypothetical protein
MLAALARSACCLVVALVVWGVIVLFESHTAHGSIEPVYTLPFLAEYTITCPWGPYQDCGFPPGSGNHNGTDMSLGGNAEAGEEVVAAMDGTAWLFENFNVQTGLGCGYYIVIDHAGDHHTRYCHLEDRTVTDGQHVVRGQLIGHEGQSGAGENNVHLHFDAREGEGSGGCCSGVSVDPFAGPYSPGTYLWTTYPPSYPAPAQLADPSFEQGNVCDSTCAWRRYDPAGGHTEWSLLSGGYSGSQYLTFSAWPVSAGSSVYQDVPVYASPGDSYTFSAWVRNGTPQCVSGTIYLFGSNESSFNAFNVCGGVWQPVSTSLDVTGVTTNLRAQIYIGQAWSNLDIDATQLIASADLHTNRSFEDGVSGWGRLDPPGGVTNWALEPGGYSGQFLRFSATQPAGSIYQDISLGVAPGQAFSFSAWVRSGGGGCVTAAINLWGLGGSNEFGAMQFNACGAWTLVSAPLPVQYSDSGLRAQIYIGQANANIDVDATHLVLLSSPGPPVDSDSDGVQNTVDNCRLWGNPSQALPAWSLQGTDHDCDGFPDFSASGTWAPETYVGTEPRRHCQATATSNDEVAPDAWPVDFDDNRIVNGQDVAKFGPAFNHLVSQGPFGGIPGERFDFTGNGIINGQDEGRFASFYNKSCA